MNASTKSESLRARILVVAAVTSADPSSPLLPATQRLALAGSTA